MPEEEERMPEAGPRGRGSPQAGACPPQGLVGQGSWERAAANGEDLWLAGSGEENASVRAAVSWGASETS